MAIQGGSKRAREAASAVSKDKAPITPKTPQLSAQRKSAGAKDRRAWTFIKSLFGF